MGAGFDRVQPVRRWDLGHLPLRLQHTAWVRTNYSVGRWFAKRGLQAHREANDGQQY
jgi:hypothetical protein